jgi:hypothetical protein
VIATISAVTPVVAGARVGVIVASLILWHWTEKLLASRNPAADACEQPSISDGFHKLTAGINRRLLDHPRQANALLIASSGIQMSIPEPDVWQAQQVLAGHFAGYEISGKGIKQVLGVVNLSPGETRTIDVTVEPGK